MLMTIANKTNLASLRFSLLRPYFANWLPAFIAFKISIGKVVQHYFILQMKEFIGSGR